MGIQVWGVFLYLIMRLTQHVKNWNFWKNAGFRYFRVAATAILLAIIEKVVFFFWVLSLNSNLNTGWGYQMPSNFEAELVARRRKIDHSAMRLKYFWFTRENTGALSVLLLHTHLVIIWRLLTSDNSDTFCSMIKAAGNRLILITFQKISYWFCFLIRVMVYISVV